MEPSHYDPLSNPNANEPLPLPPIHKVVNTAPPESVKKVPGGVPTVPSKIQSVKPALPPKTKQLLDSKIRALQKKLQILHNEYQQTSDPTVKISFFLSIKNLRAQISNIRQEREEIPDEKTPSFVNVYRIGAKITSKIFNSFEDIPKTASLSSSGGFPFNPLDYIGALKSTVETMGDFFKFAKTSFLIHTISQLEKKGETRLADIETKLKTLPEDHPDASCLNQEKKFLLEQLEPLQDLKNKLNARHAGQRAIISTVKTAFSYLDVSHAVLGFVAIFVVTQGMTIAALTLSGFSVLLTAVLVTLDFLITRANLIQASISLHNLRSIYEDFGSSLKNLLKNIANEPLKNLSEQSLEVFKTTVSPYLKQKLQSKIIEQWIYRAVGLLVIAAAAAAVTTLILTLTVGTSGLALIVVPLFFGLGVVVLAVSAPYLAKWIVRIQNGKPPTTEEFQEKLLNQMKEEVSHWDELAHQGLHIHTNTYIMYHMVKDYYTGGLALGPKEWAHSILKNPIERKRFDKVLHKRMLQHDPSRLIPRKIHKLL